MVQVKGKSFDINSEDLRTGLLLGKKGSNWRRWNKRTAWNEDKFVELGEFCKIIKRKVPV